MEAFDSWNEFYSTIVGNQVIACNHEKVVFVLSNGVIVESRLDLLPRGSHSLVEYRQADLEDFKVRHVFLKYATLATKTGTFRQTDLVLSGEEDSYGDSETLVLIRFRCPSISGEFLGKEAFASKMEWATAKGLFREAYRAVKAEEEKAR